MLILALLQSTALREFSLIKQPNRVVLTFSLNVYAPPGSAFAVYDQEAWAAQFDYLAFPPERYAAALRLFEALRTTTLPLFQHATDADWAKTARHPEWGPLTLRQLLELYADHSERHLEQILGMRRLFGKPLFLPGLLETRLY